MNRKANNDFLHSVTNRDIQLNYFQGKIRFELNLNSIDRIRHFFGLDQTKLTELLYSRADPIGKFLHEALTYNDPISRAIDKSRNLRDLEHMLLLAICNFDLIKLELVIRDLYGSSRSIKRVMDSYRPILANLKETIPNPQSDPEFTEIRRGLQYMLAKTFEVKDSSSADLTHIYYSRKSNQNHEGVVNSLQTKAHCYDPMCIFNIPFVTVPSPPE